MRLQDIHHSILFESSIKLARVPFTTTGMLTLSAEPTTPKPLVMKVSQMLKVNIRQIHMGILNAAFQQIVMNQMGNKANAIRRQFFTTSKLGTFRIEDNQLHVDLHYNYPHANSRATILLSANGGVEHIGD